MKKEKLDREKAIEAVVEFVNNSASIEDLYIYVEYFYENMENGDLEETYNDIFETNFTVE